MFELCPVTMLPCWQVKTFAIYTLGQPKLCCGQCVHYAAMIFSHDGLLRQLEQARCPGCPTTAANVVAGQRLGCPQCYAYFTEYLKPIMAKLHQGKTAHEGKRPLVLRLKTLMDEAVKVEDYESAAKYRDQIRSRDGQTPQGGSPSPV